MALRAESEKVVPGEPGSGPGWLVWLGALTVSGAAAALSFASLSALARACGVSPSLDWLFPVAIDAGVLVSTKFWLTPGLADRATRFARTLMLALILVSCLFNVSAHLLTPIPGTPFLLSAAVSLLPPLALAGVIHLMVLARAKTAPVLAVPEPVLAPAAQETIPEIADPAPVLSDPEPGPGPESGPDATVLTMRPRNTGDEDQALLDELRALTQELGTVPSIRVIKERLRVGHPKAKKLQDALDREVV